jgi:hypothetical protein
VDKTPDVKPVENGVAMAFRRLQEVNIDHFKVDLHGRKSFTVKAPKGAAASSIGCILTGHGSFYIYKAITPQEMAQLPSSWQLKAGSLSLCACTTHFSLSVFHFRKFDFIIYICYCGLQLCAGEQHGRCHYPLGKGIW